METEGCAVVALAAHLSVDGELCDNVLLRGHRTDAQPPAVVREATENGAIQGSDRSTLVEGRRGETRNRGVPARASQDLAGGKRFPRGRRAGVGVVQRSGI